MSDNKPITVTVSDGTPSPNPDPANLSGLSMPCTITWSIPQGQSYVFPNSTDPTSNTYYGIAVGSDAGDFSGWTRGSDGRSVSVTDSNADGDTISYTITVEAESGGGELTGDPSIVNRRR